MKKKRADEILAESKLVDSRTKAQALIIAGRVKYRVNAEAAFELVKKPGQALAAGGDFEIDDPNLKDVGRGAVKLRKALAQWPSIRVAGALALDIGASTGGFTQVLLDNGAEKVLALDVGTHQLHEKLRSNPKVISLEQQHVLRMTPDVWQRVGILPPFDILVTDVSFISVTKIISTAAAWLKPGAAWIILVKPQFEVGPKKAPGGIVRDEKFRQEAISIVQSAVENEASLLWKDICESPIAGGDGNKEYLLWLEKKDLP